MPTKQAFEEQFRERFENLEEAPPAFAWNKIRQEITQPAAVKAKNNPVRFKWLMPGAFIAVISVALLFMLKYNKALESQTVSNAKIHALQAEAEELREPVTEIAPIVPETEVKAANPVFKAYQADEAKTTEPAAAFVKKRYLNGAEKSAAPENLKATAAKKKLNATKVVYVVTVDPKSASVEKFSTTMPDSVAATGTAN
ncbi:hypothetical protein I5M27_01025 [Adhaeribacter sp. BT258]|uniref:Uncharacterized protein n=1 Tax=Adhaeribacter terrigena TaxID=2793070 RepID=A0ABS1BWV0_9BACT|nr:hypothetical protein [Adhaeribacter terrigena]MBK0401544.1 hypothetical protein [Adhaeribacter terrigena]